jgi:hypothetical protein
MDKPIELSAAATVKIIKAYICPKRSSKKHDIVIKLILIDNINNSKDINILIICFLNKNIPQEPIINIVKDKTK